MPAILTPRAAGDQTFATDVELDAAVDPAALEASLSGAFAALDTTPTIEELMCGPVFLATSLTGTNSYSLYAAPFALRITAFGLAVNAGVALSDTDYWTVNVRKFRSVTLGTLATKSTQATGGEAMLSHREWNFDGVTWDEEVAEFAKGDLLNVQFTKTGNPANLGNLSVGWTYEPL